MKYLLGLATSLTLTMNGTNTLHASDLMAGIHPFLCNDESFVIVEDNDTWSIANSNLEVLATDNGWRLKTAMREMLATLQRRAMVIGN